MTVTPREYIDEIDKSANYIRGIIGSAEIPGICTVLGSGLSPLADHCEDKITVPYADIPGFPISTQPDRDHFPICPENANSRIMKRIRHRETVRRHRLLLSGSFCQFNRIRIDQKGPIRLTRDLITCDQAVDVHRRHHDKYRALTVL